MAIRGVTLDVTGVLQLPDPDWLAGRLREHGLRPDPALLPRAFYVATRAYDDCKARLVGAAGVAPAVPAGTFGAAYAAAGGLPDGPVAVAAVERVLLAEPVPLEHRRPLPGAEDLLHRLVAHDLRVGVVANTSDGQTVAWLRHAGLHAAAPAVVDSAVAGVRKPDPRAFSAALAALRLPATEVLHVGDSLHLDVAGARQAGLDCLHFDPFRLCTRPDHPHATTLDGVLPHVLRGHQPRSGRP